jgi:hypothetical protein
MAETPCDSNKRKKQARRHMQVMQETNEAQKKKEGQYDRNKF